MSNKNHDTTILYVFDPLCGWCYGFTPVVIQLKNDYSTSMNFDIISGGMVTGSRIGPLSNMAGYILSAYKTVEQKTGITFGDKYINGTLRDETAIQTSIPSSKLLMAFKQIDKSNRSIEFAHQLQRAMYYDGVYADDYHGLAEVGRQFDVDPDELIRLAKTDEIRAKTRDEFQLSSELKVSGYPTVFLHKDQRLFAVARGADSYANVKSRIDSLLN